MKKSIAAFAVMILGVTIFSSEGFAAGFRLPDQDAAAMGTAGAFVGQADNPSAAWYNPAGLTQLDGTRMSAGVIAIYPVLSHENADGTTDVSKREVHVPAELFVTSKMNDKIFLGLSVTSPFGLSTDWSKTSETRYVATFSKITTFDINPNIALKLSDRLSVAAGLDYVKLKATMEKMLDLSPLGLGDRGFVLRGDGDGWGVNAGVKYMPNDRLGLGLSYRSRVKINVDGTAAVNAPIPGNSNSAKTDITLPDLIQFGTSYKATEKLTVNADLEYTWWSTYDRLIITSNTIRALTGSDVSIEEKDWKNTWSIRIGGQYQLSEQWKLRAGYVYDQSPVPSGRLETRVPDSDRQGVTIGAGYNTCGNVTIDASYMYLHFMSRSISNSIAGGSTPIASLDGTYKGTAQLLAITVAYKF